MFKPVEIEILMYYHYNPDDHPRIHTESVKRAINTLINEGLLHIDSKETTEKGVALIEKICETEMPEQIWGYRS